MAVAIAAPAGSAASRALVPDEVLQGNRAVAAAMVKQEGAELAVARCLRIAEKAAAEGVFEIYDSFTDFADEVKKRVDAMKFYATGRTAAGLRAQAISLTVERLGASTGDDPGALREVMLTVADGIDQLVAEGLTPQDCYDQLDLENMLGRPYRD